MDEKKANIDLVFRNGLKDYEVLPPPEAWNNIIPVVRKKQRPLFILRTAAAVAILLSLTFLAYRMSRQITGSDENNFITLNDENESRQSSPVGEKITPLQILLAPSDASTLKRNSIVPIYPSETPEQNTQLTGNNGDPLQNVSYLAGSDNISVNESKTSVSDLLLLFETADKKIKTEDPATLFTPEILTEKKSEKWSIAALVSPTYHTNFYPGNDQSTSRLGDDEQALFSYSGGVAFSYKINKRVSVQSGLYYSSFGQELSGITSFGGFQDYDYSKSGRNFEVLTTNGLVYTNNADIFLLDSRSDTRLTTRYTKDYFDPAKANLRYIDNSLRQNFSYLEVPVIVRYKLIDKTIDFNLVGGLSSNLLVNNSVYAAVEGGKYQVGKTEGLNLITFSSSLGMGMEYNISNNLSLNLEPTFRYYLNPVSQILGLRIHPYSFGIYSGISYRF
jgi:hypothetical protein